MGDLEKQKNQCGKKESVDPKRRKEGLERGVWRSWGELCLTCVLRVDPRVPWTTFVRIRCENQWEALSQTRRPDREQKEEHVDIDAV